MAYARPAAAPQKRRALLLPTAVLSILLITAAPAASGYWSATQRLTPSLSAGTLATPVLTCTSMPAVGLTAPFARITWPAVAHATGYTATLTNNSGATVMSLATNTAATSVDVTAGLLGGLLATLLSGGQLHVVVRALHTSGWTSELSLSRLIKPGLLGGVACG